MTDTTRQQDSSYRRRVLDRFPTDGSWVTNLFSFAIRSGARSGPDIVEAVFNRLDILRHHQESRNREREILEEIRDHIDEALDFPLWVDWWEGLTKKEKSRMKAPQSAFWFCCWMGSQPPSEKQLALLQRLGHTGEIDNMREASQLIDQFLPDRGSSWRS